jgi:hypothetical protein
VADVIDFLGFYTTMCVITFIGLIVLRLSPGAVARYRDWRYKRTWLARMAWEHEHPLSRRESS